MNTAGYSFYNTKYITVTQANGSVVVKTHGQEQTANWSGDPVASYVTIQAGIAGPPSGQVYLARVDMYGYGTYSTDQKYAILAGGNYSIWHGGGVSGAGLVVASTDLSW